MGNCHGSRSRTASGPEVYCLRHREIRIMNEIWKSVESDLPHYGVQFYDMLFHNHPEYLKYFQTDKPHEYQADVPIMRAKFALVCSTLATLFVDYSHKPRPREHLLGYVAMVHKDMNLSQKDMENFMLDMMEMLLQQFPQMMSAECCLAYMRYASSLTSRIQFLMKKHRDIRRMSRTLSSKTGKKVVRGCPCSKAYGVWPWRNNVNHLIYGHPPDYWESKSQQWIIQRAAWATSNQGKHLNSTRKLSIAANNIVNISHIPSSRETSSSDEANIEESRKLVVNALRRRPRSTDLEMSQTPPGTNIPLQKQKDVSAMEKQESDTETDSKHANIYYRGRRPSILQGKRTSDLTNRTSSTKSQNDLQHPQNYAEMYIELCHLDTGFHQRPANRGRNRSVFIASTATPRERRRWNLLRNFPTEQPIQTSTELRATKQNTAKQSYPLSRRLTIHNGMVSVQNENDSSSMDDTVERKFKSDLLNSLDITIKRSRDRATSISNVAKKYTSGRSRTTDANKPHNIADRRQTSFAPVVPLPPGITGSGTAMNRNTKSNKRVSISYARWSESD